MELEKTSTGAGSVPRKWDYYGSDESRKRKLAAEARGEVYQPKKKKKKHHKASKGKSPLLQPQVGESEGKMTLCLDLDKTLVYADHTRSFYFKIGEKTVEIPLFLVAKRPFVDEFLREMAENFELVLFTCGSRGYAKRVLREVLDPDKALFKHVVSRESCTKIPEGRTKDLSLLGRDMRKVLIVDDNPLSFKLNPKNGIEIRPFEFLSETTDEYLELQALGKYLKTISGAEDVTALSHPMFC